MRKPSRTLFVQIVLCLGLVVTFHSLRLAGPAQAQSGNPALDMSVGGSRNVFLPLVRRASAPPSCAISGQHYGSLSVGHEYPVPNAEGHPDFNLALRGYQVTNAPRQLVTYNYDNPPDAAAPRLYGLFADQRTPVFSNVFRVYDWNWDCNCRGGLNSAWPVTIAGMATSAGEVIRVPDRSGGVLDPATHYKVLVLYATTNRITLQYSRDDHTIRGYTLHIDNVCVEPSLLNLYRALNSQGRHSLPALYPNQPFGRALGSEIQVAIRDSGSFMDPRSRLDWWPDR